MTQTAKLGTRDFVCARGIRLKVERDVHAWYEILFNPELPDEEAVDDVERVERQRYGPARRDAQGRANDVVLCRGIRVVETKRIAGSLVHEADICSSEL